MFLRSQGTDNGLEFGSLDIDKSPREKIARITSTSPNTQSFLSPSAVIPMGNFKFTFVSMAATPARKGLARWVACVHVCVCMCVCVYACVFVIHPALAKST